MIRMLFIEHSLYICHLAENIIQKKLVMRSIINWLNNYTENTGSIQVKRQLEYQLHKTGTPLDEDAIHHAIYMCSNR